MVDKTVSELITEIESELYQVSGPATQVYLQDMIVKRINDAFITFFDDPTVSWKRFNTYATYTLNGTTGEATGTVSSTFADYNDIEQAFPATSDSPLVAWNRKRNPALLTGSQPLFIAPSSTTGKIFKVIPATATGDVVLIGKQRPSTFPFDDLADTVPFDYLCIKYFVAWNMLADDGANPSSADLVKTKFIQRYESLKKNQDKEPIALNGRSGSIPQNWFDPDA